MRKCHVRNIREIPEKRHRAAAVNTERRGRAPTISLSISISADVTDDNDDDEVITRVSLE